jgi:hypothetical protein
MTERALSGQNVTTRKADKDGTFTTPGQRHQAMRGYSDSIPILKYVIISAIAMLSP